MTEYTEFEPIDTIFAERILRPFPQVSEEAHLFLAKLMAATREGHLCIAHEKGADALPHELVDEIVCHAQDRWYLKRSWDAEQLFLTHWKRLNKSAPKEIVFEEDLTEVMKKVAENSITLICGGPGTGKSTLAAKLVQLFLPKMTGAVALAAPTGKATANLRVALGSVVEKCTIQTLHALLQKKKRLPFDLIVVDEASMIDAELMGRLFSAVKEGARLLLLGDKDQLPPVESGHLFTDLAAAYPERVLELKTCYRTDLQEIISMAAAVQKGKKIPIATLPDVKAVVKMIADKKPWEPSSRFCALSPIRGGPYGVDTLNALLYQEQKKRAPQASVPIIITTNDSKLSLFNGDIGWLDEKSKTAFFSKDKEISTALLPPFEYAYVLSVHKSQGSEYDDVLILLPRGAENFGREMLYTAITRARKKVTLLGTEEILNQILSKETRRLSGIMPLGTGQ